MGWKCAPQIMGLTIGEPKPGAKHRMPLRKACMEAGYERATLSDTFDRSRSHLNRYTGYTSGKECAYAMEAEAEYTTVTLKDGRVRQRKSRSDAVPGFAVIFNPPAEVCQAWDDATYEKFYSDAWDCICVIKPNIFRAENIVMKDEHFDEGVPPEDSSDVTQIDRHMHLIGYARNASGKWCGNEIDAAFLADLNKRFPTMMRKKGWEMDDLDTTDFARAKSDSAYRAERNAKRKNSGKSVNNHIKHKAEDNLKRAEQILDEAETVHGIAFDMLAEAEGADAYAADIRQKAKREKEDAAAYVKRKLKEGKAVEYETEQKKTELETVALKVRLLQDRISGFTDRVLKHMFSRSRSPEQLQQMDLEEKWDFIESEFQQREDALETQKTIVAEQKKVFSPTDAARYILRVLKTRYQKAHREEMVSSITILERQVDSGAAAFNRQYFADRIRQKSANENLRKKPFAEAPDMQKTKSKEWQFE